MDAADKQWHLTSPTPYDPPLTYGGWRQSEALGAKIASIIHTRETVTDSHPADDFTQRPSLTDKNGENQDKDSSPNPKLHQAKRRKHKVLIHTSPFLRCIQTSIAISAGLAEYQDPPKPIGHASNAKAHPMHSAHAMHSGSPSIRAMQHVNAPHLDAISEPDEELEESQQDTWNRAKHIDRSKLRVDAFLGEWLSPDYFESITPPPSSVMMVAGAKADLLRQGEHSLARESRRDSANHHGNFPGGWGSNGTTSKGTRQDESVKGAIASMSSLKQSLPRLDRSNSHSSDGCASNRPIEKGLSNFDIIPDLKQAEKYIPPTPSYAISPLDAIPPGYVAHAKEYCVDVDYAWDSMRPPLEWGNGGEYGEEWSAMHKRFRRGLHNMILWYGSHSTSKRPDGINEDKAENQFSDVDDLETDTVLVLVTHGAGCNALIGALTNQPVLLDVGMASLTMAVRKENRRKPASSTDSPVRTSRRRSSIDLGISDNYDVKLTASTEHLRAGTHTKSSSLSQRSSTMSSPQVSAHRHRSSSTMSTTSTNSSSDGILNAEFEIRPPHGIGPGGSLQRSASAAVHSSNGLWSRPVTDNIDGISEEEVRQSVPANRDPTPLRTNVPLGKPESNILDHASEIMSPTTYNQSPTVGQQGLWGAPPPVPSTERDKGPKRRWTHSEHG